jgi:hypothetical protein
MNLFKAIFLKFNSKLIVLTSTIGFLFFISTYLNNVHANESLSSEEKSLEWRTTDEALNNNVVEAPQNIIAVTFQFEQAAQDKMRILDISAQTGYYPIVRSDSPEYSLVIKDIFGRKVYGTSFMIPRLPDLDNSNLISNFTLNLPYDSTAFTLGLYDSKGNLIETKNVLDLEIAKVEPNFTTIKGDELQSGKLNSLETAKAANDGFVDITFIGDDYTDSEMSQFQSDATRVANGILQIEPLKTRSSQIRFHTVNNTVDLSCGHYSSNNLLITCDNNKVIAELNRNSAVYDKVVVLYKNDVYGGAAYVDGVISIAYNGQHASIVASHELSHTFGLLDEYSYGTTNVNYLPNRNCYNLAGENPGWADIVGSQDYFLECSASNWYRSSKSSLMKDMASYHNAVSVNYMNRVMDTYTGPFTPTLEVPSVTITCPRNNYIDRKDILLCLTYSNTNPVSGIDILIDGKLWTTYYSKPPYYNLSSNNISDGIHNIQVRAFDGLNRKGGSGSVTIDLRNTVPFGFIENITDGNVKGWAIDSNNTAASIGLEFYQDGPKGQGVYMGSAIANINRTEIEEPGNHGFLWSIPSQFRDSRSHTVWAYATDTSGNVNDNRHLHNNGNSYQLVSRTWNFQTASQCGFESTRIAYSVFTNPQSQTWQLDAYAQGTHAFTASTQTLNAKAYIVMLSPSGVVMPPVASSNTGIKFVQRPVYNLSVVPNGSYQYVAEIDSNLLASGTYTIDFQKYSDCTRTWTIRVQSTCASTPVSSSFAVWPPNPLVWTTDSYAAGVHTLNITSNNPTSSIYVMLSDNSTDLVPTGTRAHPNMVYGTYFNPLTPMAKWNSAEVPAGTYTITYQDTNTSCTTVRGGSGIQPDPVTPVSTSYVMDSKRYV